MTRDSAAEEGEHLLLDALRGLHMNVATRSGQPAADLVLDVDGRHLLLEVKRFALVDAPRAAHLVSELPAERAAAVLVVIGDRIVESARDRLRAAGVSWFDLRGHLFLSAPGLRVDVATARAAPKPPSPRALGGRVGVATAIDLLLHHPSTPVSVRETARRIDAAPSGVSNAMKGLREDGLMDASGAVDLPALFWATAKRWQPQWVPVSRYPHPAGPMRNPALALRLDDPRSAGWALTGDLAAAHLGAPIGLAAGSPPDFYVPTRQAHRLAVSILDEQRSSAPPAARLAVAPVTAACLERVDVAGIRDQHWLLARSLFVALELAQDPGRGAAILEQWSPTEGGSRVW